MSGSDLEYQEVAERLERLERERALFYELLSLGQNQDLEPFLERALKLVTDVTGAKIGYIEIRDPSGSDEHWSVGTDSDALDLEMIREQISRGIIAEALLSGETIETSSAATDHRFSSRASVRVRGIEAVLCAPIGGDAALGIVYLQGGRNSGAFGQSDRGLAELFAFHVAPLVDRVLVRRQLAESEDPTRILRSRYKLDDIVGRSRAIAGVLEQAMLAAPLDVNVILRGESGTGKSQLAKSIHVNSHRSQGPFIELNCAALPDTLIESELFGASAGSHSEARADREGMVAAAERGTLFLDEIGELPLNAQSKLLQLLHAREYYPLGSNQPRKADIRIIAATNADLEEAIEERKFRKDLFYRLQVLPLELPPLSQRSEDLELISVALLERVCREHNLTEFEFSRSALLLIRAAEWPGNVRQLNNAIEAAAIRAMGSNSSKIEGAHLFPAHGEGGEGSDSERILTFQEATREFQQELLERVLEESDWNVREVARRLDLARSHVYNLIKAFDLSRR